MKICNKCKINKSNTEYYPRTARGKIILNYMCKKEQIHNRNPYLTIKRKDNSGIRRVKNSKVPRWRVSVSVRGKEVHVGQYTSFEVAKIARDDFVAHIK